MIGGAFQCPAVLAATAADSVITRAPVESDSGVWIPREAAELDAPDRLEERGAESGWGARIDLRGGRWAPRTLWIEEGLPGAGRIRAAWLFRDDGAGTGTLIFRPVSWLAASSGAIVGRRTPALFGEALGLIAPQRVPRSPSTESPDLESPRGVSSRTVRGGAVTVRRGGERGPSAAVWAVAGRDVEDRDVRAAGIVFGGAARGAAAIGEVHGVRRAVSVTLESRGAAGHAAAEVLVAPERGPELLAEVVRSGGPLRVETRWRRRPGEARPVSGELGLRVATAWTRARLTWRPWSARATGDDGKVELETSGPGPIRIRIGSRGGDLEGAPTASHGSTRRERYAIADLLVARERRRSVSLLASARETSGLAARSVASSVGGRLELSARGRAGATLLMQARRAVAAGRASVDAPAAWTASIAPSGEESLTSRAGSGIVASGRAWLRLGSFRFEALVSDAALADGELPTSASLRIQWERREPRNGSP